MSNSEFYITPSGSSVELSFEGSDPHPHRNAERYVFSASSSSGGSERISVSLVEPTLINGALAREGLPDLKSLTDDLTRLAAVIHFDELDSLATDHDGNRIVEIDAQHALDLIQRPRVGDRDIRRFIVRRLYQGYSRTTLRQGTTIADFDLLLLGASITDIVRNAQVLAEEGYLAIESGAENRLTLHPTARLVREVERYGAAREDVASERDYLHAIAAYAPLKPHLQTVQLEYQRHTVALTPTELGSVFKAISPVVETIVKDLLKAHGSTKQHPTLGPAIADLQARGIGDQSLVSQLSHILKFARDLAQHGSTLPIPVLRIASENAFELIPQLGALFPRGAA